MCERLISSVGCGVGALITQDEAVCIKVVAQLCFRSGPFNELRHLWAYAHIAELELRHRLFITQSANLPARECN